MHGLVQLNRMRSRSEEKTNFGGVKTVKGR